VDVVIEVLFSLLTAILLGMIYRLMTWLSRIEKQVIELKTDMKWLKAYILKINGNNQGDKNGDTTDNTNV
jgi:hypothetical protein